MREILTAQQVIAAYREGRREFQGIGLDGGDVDFHGAMLRAINLEGALLRYADFQEANLERARLRGANLYQSDLRGAFLSSSELYLTDLTETNLSGSHLREAYTNGASFRRATITPDTEFSSDDYAIISEILRQWAISKEAADGNYDLRRHMIAMVILISSGCWDTFTHCCPAGFEELAEQALLHLETFSSVERQARAARIHILHHIVAERQQERSAEPLRHALSAAREQLEEHMAAVLSSIDTALASN